MDTTAITRKIDLLLDFLFENPDAEKYSHLKAYNAIGRRIVGGGLSPGVTLNIRTMADETGVSMTPVMAAMERLSAEGLVEYEAGKRYRVMPLTRDNLIDRYHARLALEVQIARIIGNGEIDDVEREEIFNLARQVDTGKYLLDFPFHMCLARTTGMSYITENLRRIFLFLVMRNVHLMHQGITRNMQDWRHSRPHQMLADTLLTDNSRSNAERQMRVHLIEGISGWMGQEEALHNFG